VSRRDEIMAELESYAAELSPLIAELRRLSRRGRKPRKPPATSEERDDLIRTLLLDALASRSQLFQGCRGNARAEDLTIGAQALELEG
jgi:hypothetical protein